MTSISNSARGLGGPLDLGVASLAAVSIGFLAFAMPEDLFSSLVSASHLPDLVAAAAPPLGMTARYAVMGAGAALAFLVCWSLLRALDGRPASRPKPVRKEAEPDAPRVRRADAHPDAPSRRPLFAGADLGEPEPLETIDTIGTHETPDTDVYELETPEYAVEDSAEAVDLAVETAPVEESVPAGRLPRFLVTEPEAAPPPRNPIVPPAHKTSVEGFGARPPRDPEAVQADSIGSLMHRLERGLAEREEPEAEPDLPAPLAEASANPEISLSPEGVRHRLRSAISELNQQASRG